MENLNVILYNNLYIITVIVFLAFLFCLIILLKLRSEIKAVRTKYEEFTKGSTATDIDTLLREVLQSTRTDHENLNVVQEELKKTRLQLAGCVQHVKVVRFNAFADTGSNLSYAVSLLNAKNDGVVLSSIFGREENRCYAKPIANGNSEYALSEEEEQAIGLK